MSFVGWTWNRWTIGSLEVNARADHADRSSEVELQGMLAIIDDHEDAGDHLQEFEHRMSRKA